MEESRTIKIKEKTYNKLKSLGSMHESFDDVINRLIFQEKTKPKDLSSKIAKKL